MRQFTLPKSLSLLMLVVGTFLLSLGHANDAAAARNLAITITGPTNAGIVTITPTVGTATPSSGTATFTSSISQNFGTGSLTAFQQNSVSS